MSIKLPFRHLEPYFFAGLFDDPILLIRINPGHRMLMFDCGQIHHLAKRIFTHLDTVFISHAHMDHWMGIDSVIRHLIVADRTINIYGPPGLADKMEAKLKGYDWNLTENYWCDCRVYEIADKTLTSWLFIGAQAFRRQQPQQQTISDQVIYTDDYCQVKAETCYHDIVSIVYRIEEKPPFIIDQETLTAHKIVPGPWLSELKKIYLSASHPPGHHHLLSQIEQATGLSSAQLIETYVKKLSPLAMGYISDISFDQRNLNKLLPFMANLQLLISECTYLANHRQRARAADHLCTTDLSQLLKNLKPSYFLPMHLSKSYRKQPEKLYTELLAPPETTILSLPPFLTPQPLQTDAIKYEAFENEDIDRKTT